MLKYIQEFQKEADGNKFHVITFEQQVYAMPKEKIASTKIKLKNDYSIYWTPLSYHTGGSLLLLKKVWDFALVLRLAIQLKRKHRIANVIGFTSLSGSIAYMISKIIGTPLVLMNIEPHSDYMADFGYWKRSGLSYRILHFLENRQIRHAKFTAVPTQNAFNKLKNDLTDYQNLHFIPTCIRVNDFYFNSESRERIRNSIGVDANTIVLTYIGKFGGIYYTVEQMAETLRSIFTSNDDIFLYIITTDDMEHIKNVFNKAGLEHKYVLKGQIKYEEISDYLSVGDLGLLFIPPYPSQLYRCPIKTANYLACGLPYLITENIGDDSRLANELNIGIVLNSLKQIELHKKMQEIIRNKEQLNTVVHKLRDIKYAIDFLRLSLN